jgi:hypothetical protein
VGSQGFAAALHAPKKVKTDDAPPTNLFGGGGSSNVFGSRTGSLASVFGSKEKEDGDDAEDEDAEDAEETQTSSFGERLRAAGAGDDEAEDDEQRKVNLEEQDGKLDLIPFLMETSHLT